MKKPSIQLPTMNVIPVNAPSMSVPSMNARAGAAITLAAAVAVAVTVLAAPAPATAQNRFGDTPAAASGAGGGRPAGGAQGPSGGGGSAQGAGAGGGSGGLGALAGPGGIADPRGASRAQGPQGQQGAQGQQGGQAGAAGGQRGGAGVDLERLEAHELQDHGVAPTQHLHAGPMHGPTPASIPGAQVVTTRKLVGLIRAATAPAEGGGSARHPLPLYVFDVLGGPEILPGARGAVPAHQAGSFDDAVQREFGSYLRQVTGGNPRSVLVFYCASTQCWMSYNAALRAARAGFQHVLWYRGGIEAWKAAGLPVQAPGAAQAGGGARR